MFDLHFWGFGAAKSPLLGNNNAWFEMEENLYLIDCGESSFQPAVRTLDFGKYRCVYVLITHMHSDHTGGLGSLLSWMAVQGQKNVVLVHPLDTPVQMLNLQGVGRHFYRYMTELPPESPVQAKIVEVQHVGSMKSYAYLLKCADDCIYYSGDAAFLPAEMAEAFLNGSIRRIYHDTASHESNNHCWVQRLMDAIPPEKRKEVYCMHLDGEYTPLLRELGFSVVNVK